MGPVMQRGPAGDGEGGAWAPASDVLELTFASEVTGTGGSSASESWSRATPTTWSKP